MNRLLLLSISLGCLPDLPNPDSGSSICHALEFDGSNDYVEIANSASLDLGNDDFTIEMWVWFKPAQSTDSDAGRILGRTSSWKYFWLGYEPSSGGFAPRVWLSESKAHFVSWTSETVIPHETWTHLALEREGTFIRILVDGSNPMLIGGNQAGDTQATAFNLDINGPMMISRNPNGLGEDGLSGWPGRVHGLQIVPWARYGRNEFTPEFPLLQDSEALIFLPFSEGAGDFLMDASGDENIGEIEGANWTEIEDPSCGDP